MSISFWPAIQQVSGGVFGSPNSIMRDSQWTIVMVDTGGGGGGVNQYVELPAGSELGDLVEVHYMNGNTPQVSAPSGDSIVGGTIVPGPGSFRKVDTNLWSRTS